MRFFLKAFLIAIVIFIITLTSLVSLLDAKFFDNKLLLRGEIEELDDIVIVAIDNESIDWLEQWPWPRSFHSKIVDILSEEQAKLVLFDVFFDSPTTFAPEDDLNFGKALKSAGNVLLAANFQPIISNELFTVKKIPYKKPIPVLNDSALDVGLVHPHLDSDNVVRSFQILTNSDGNYYPSLALMAVKHILNQEIEVVNNQLLKVGNINIPLEEGRVLINYAGKSGSFKTIPYGQVLDKSFIYDNPEFFKDKIVLIGATALELQDVFPTPFDKITPGVEIHANVINTILGENFIKKIGWIGRFLSIFLITLFVLFLGKKVKIFHHLLISGILLVLVFIINLIFFIKFKLEVPTFSLLLGIIIVEVYVIFSSFFKEEREKKKIRAMFSQYVAPAIVDQLLDHPEQIKMGGIKKELTIFFCDIRSFTTFSEKHTPEQVVEQLNEFLDAMTEIIFEYHGTLDKYVGDEIMAVFGAPLDLEDHPKKAVQCAIAQIKKIQELQAKWKSEGKDTLEMGVGINTGEVIVGNMGSQKVKDYTVIGDEVNLAARLESATRQFSTPDKLCYILISEKVYQYVKNDFKCVFKDEIKVKGKDIATKVYEVVVE